MILVLGVWTFRRALLGLCFARTVISQKVSPRGFSKPFHHPEGRRSFSAYGILSTLSKSFSA